MRDVMSDFIEWAEELGITVQNDEQYYLDAISPLDEHFSLSRI